MHVLILGAGGIGGYYGGRLAHAGIDVSFVARGAHLEALRTKGLTVIRDSETITLPPLRAHEDPAYLPAPDLILVTTKAYDLEQAIARAAPVIGRETIILPLVNGVDIPQRIASALNGSCMQIENREPVDHRIMAGLTYIPANRPRPGVVHQPGNEHPLIFGEVSESAPGRADSILALFERAGILAKIATDVQQALWTKFMLVTANGGVCGVTRATMGQVVENPETLGLYEGVCREVEAVARARGIVLAKDVVEKTIAHGRQSPVGNKPSLLQDLEGGRRLELEVLHGTLVRLGREAGVPVPVSTMIHAALKPFAEGAPTLYKPS